MVMSFDGFTLYAQLTHKPGAERLDVLDNLQAASSEESGSIVGNWMSK